MAAARADHGEVIAANWLSNVQVTANNFFKPVMVAGYLAAPVPEPENLGDGCWPGLGLIGFMARRQRANRLTFPGRMHRPAAIANKTPP